MHGCIWCGHVIAPGDVIRLGHGQKLHTRCGVDLFGWLIRSHRMRRALTEGPALIPHATDGKEHK